jgi:hypothetical protein
MRLGLAAEHSAFDLKETLLDRLRATQLAVCGGCVGSCAFANQPSRRAAARVAKSVYA